MTSLISRGGKGSQLCLQHNKQSTAVFTSFVLSTFCLVEIICYFPWLMVYNLLSCSHKILSGLLRRFTQHFFLYKLTRLKAVHSTLLFIVVIAVRWSHRQAYRGSIRSFILSLFSREQLTEASKATEFISTARGSKI